MAGPLVRAKRTDGVTVQAQAVMVVGGEPIGNIWVRDGLAGAAQAFALPLPALDLHVSDADTPPQAFRRLLYPSLVSAVRSASAPRRSVGETAARVWDSVRQSVEAHLGHRPIVSVPEGLGFAEWLADECDVRIVCLVSDALTLAAHHKCLATDESGERWLDRACREWAVSAQWVAGYRQRRRDFVFVGDDEIIGEPFVGFHRLYRQLDLPWSSRSQAVIAAMMDDGPPGGRRRARPEAWRDHLTPKEVATVCARTSSTPSISGRSSNEASA